MIPDKVLQTAADLYITQGPITLNKEQTLGVYEYIEKGKHESAFMHSLRAQARVESILSPNQLTKAAGILKGNFKKYLVATNQGIELQEDGNWKLVPLQDTPVEQPTPPRQRGGRKCITPGEAG